MPENKPKPENPFTSILINIIIPVCILTFLSKDKYLGPVWALVIAVAFPVTHGVKTLIRERKADVLAIIGLVSVLLTGIFGILELPPEWVARKEAAVPLLMGLLIVLSLKTPFPLIKKLMLTESLFDVERLHQALREKGNEARFEKRLVGLTWGFASAMFLSSVLSYILAKIVLQSEPGTEAYAAELGKMTGLSHVVVLVPVMVVMLFVFNALFNALTQLTGLELDDVLAAHHRKEKAHDDVSPAEEG
jgi:hypothetical protein